MIQRLIGALLTTAFAAISLLGHGGLHALPGGHACHGHAAHFGAANQHSEGHSHAHAHGGGCHHAAHSHGPGEDHRHEPSPPVPQEHDHEDCLICQWHAQGQITTVEVGVPLGHDIADEAVRAASQVATSYRLTTLFTRGPPAA